MEQEAPGQQLTVQGSLTRREAYRRPAGEVPKDGAEDLRSSAAAGAQHSQAAMRELSTAQTMGEPESQGRRDGDSPPSASSPPGDGAENDRSSSPERAPGVPGVSIKMMEKFIHSAGAAPREDSSSPPSTLDADRHGPASWRPMAVGAAGFSASMAKFLHMQHKAATATAAGKRKREETEDCGGEDPADLGQSARCSTDKALASGYKTSPGYGGEKAARQRSESPSSSEHPLSINSTSSLLHSINRTVPEDASLEGGGGAERIEGGW